VDVFIDRKHGREQVAYPHPSLRPILEDTYGVIVYQEQVMQISQVLAGYSLGRADLLRRAMGKKKAEEMARERAGFVDGARRNGVDEKVASGIFDLMEKFAAYGFNKSHSAAYGLLTVQTAWLKAHYPVEFTAALISSEAGNTDKVVPHILEAREHGIEVLPPDANESQLAFSVHGAKIRFGLGAVRGLGESAVEAILAARQGEGSPGKFLSLFDFAARIDARRINKKVIEALVKSGAFDFEGVPRWQLMAGIDAALAAGATAQADRASGQASLFGALPEAVAPRPRYPRAGETVGESVVEEWPERVRLAFEKEALGFYLTGHPLAGYEKEARRYASATCAQVAQKRAGDKVAVVGVVASLRERQNKEKGTRFGFFTLEDLTGTAEVICWGSRPASGTRPAQKGWIDWEETVKRDEPLLVHGEVRIDTRDEENPKREIVAAEIELLSAVRTQKTSEVALRIDADHLTADRAGELKALLARHAGACAVTVRAVIPGESETTLRIGARVSACDDLIEAARRLGFEVELR
jgi:DNA polymerase-3 subunit alpha